MTDELAKYKEEESQKNDRKIEDAIEVIFKDPKKSPLIESLKNETGLHRNTLSGRSWHLSRPLSFGDKIFHAGELVDLTGLLDVIKKHRNETRSRRTKSQMKQAKHLAEEVTDLSEIVENMREENSQLFLETEDLKEQLRLLQRISDSQERALKEKIQEIKDLRNERYSIQMELKDAQQKLQEFERHKNKPASLTVLKAPKDDK